MNPQLLGQLGGLAGLGRGGAAPQDGPVVDTAETVHISSLALLKMLKHGAFLSSILQLLNGDYLCLQMLSMKSSLRPPMDDLMSDDEWQKRIPTNATVSLCIGRAGVPMEVMGLMLGELVDDYTVRCLGTPHKPLQI
jgi:hypothetical protein